MVLAAYRQATDTSQMIRQSDCHWRLFGRDIVDAVPTLVASIPEMLKHTKGSVERAEACWTNIRLYMIALFGSNIMHPKGVDCELLRALKGCKAFIALKMRQSSRW